MKSIFKFKIHHHYRFILFTVSYKLKRSLDKTVTVMLMWNRVLLSMLLNGELIMGWPLGWPFFELTVRVTFFWVDRTGWPFFGLIVRVDLFLDWPSLGFTAGLSNGSNFFWVDRMGWLFFGLTQLTGWATGSTTNTKILIRTISSKYLQKIYINFLQDLN